MVDQLIATVAPPVCATCEVPVTWRHIVIAGQHFGCAGGVVGGPCTYDYATPSEPPAGPPLSTEATSAPIEAEAGMVPPPAAAAAAGPSHIPSQAPATPAVPPRPPAPVILPDDAEPSAAQPAAPSVPEPELPLRASLETRPAPAEGDRVAFPVRVVGVDGDDEVSQLTEQLRAIAAPGTVRLLVFDGTVADFEVQTPDRAAFISFLGSLPDFRFRVAETDDGLELVIEQAMQSETLNVIASRFDSFARLNEFVSEVRSLPGVREVRMRRLVQGVLHLAVDYEAPVPLPTRFRELRGFKIRTGKIDADGTIEVFVTPVDERITGGR